MIYVECKPDQILVQVLLNLPNKDVVHAQNKSHLFARLSKRSDTIGIADEDPGSPQPKYLSGLSIVQDIPAQGLKIFEDSAHNNRVVLLSPKLEDWILLAARDAQVSLSDRRYNLPTSPTSLHREINFDLRKFLRLASDLKETQWFTSLRESLSR